MFLDDKLYEVVKEAGPTITDKNIGKVIAEILEKVIVICKEHLTEKIKESNTHYGLTVELDKAVKMYRFFLDKVLKEDKFYTRTLWMMLRLHNPIGSYMRNTTIRELYKKGKNENKKT